MEKVSPTTREPTDPFPPRFWWLKRLSAGGFLLVLLLAGTRAAWGWAAERRFERAIAPVRARGEPLVAAELNPPQVPDHLNAAWYLKRAIAAIDPNADSPASTSMMYPDHPPYGAAWDTTANKSVTASAKVFPLVRQARAYDQFDFGWRIKDPVPATALPHLNDVRHLANTVCDAALYAHVNGDDVAALETVRDVRHLAKGIRTEPFIISSLVADGIDSLALSRLQVIASGLRVAERDGPPPPAPVGGPQGPVDGGPFPAPNPVSPPRPATPSHVRQVISELLDAPGLSEMAVAVAGERVAQTNTVDWVAKRAPVTRPMFRLDAARMLEANAVYGEAARKPTLPAAKAVIDTSPATASLPPPPKVGLNMWGFAPAPARRDPLDYTRMLSAEFVGGNPTRRTLVQNARVVAHRRMTAVSLAAQLYRAEHGGAWPESMEALVPRYLPALPQDPLAKDGGPLRYMLLKGALPGGGDRPVVYSAGDNGTWDTVDGTGLGATPVFGWHGWRDEYLDLTRWQLPAPTTAPATPVN
jgi:hypothetical protein